MRVNCLQIFPGQKKRFHAFTLRILGHVPRLTPPAIDQQSSHRSSRGGPPGYAPARCLWTHAIRGMTTKATRQVHVSRFHVFTFFTFSRLEYWVTFRDSPGAMGRSLFETSGALRQPWRDSRRRWKRAGVCHAGVTQSRLHSPRYTQESAV